MKPQKKKEIAQDSRDEILATIVSKVRNLLGVSPSEELDHQMPLVAMGLDDVASKQLVRQLEARLDLQLSPTLLFRYPTIDTLSEHLLDQKVGDSVGIAGRPDDVYPAKQVLNHRNLDDHAKYCLKLSSKFLMRVFSFKSLVFNTHRKMPSLPPLILIKDMIFLHFFFVSQR